MAARKHDFGPSTLERGTPRASLRYLSVSQVQAFDAEGYGGCETRWWLERVDGRKVPETKGQKLGGQKHAQLELWQNTGDNGVLDRWARAAKQWVVSPAAGVEVVIPPFLEAKLEDGRVERFESAGELQAAGVPFLGYIDRLDRSGFYYDNDGMPVHENHPEVLDWKFSRSLDFAKTPEQVASSVQMTGYGLVAMQRAGTARVRLSHVTSTYEGAPQSEKSSIVVDRARLEQQWARVGRVVERMKAVVRMASVGEPHKNPAACDSFGGCPHKLACPRDSQDVVFAYLGLPRAVPAEKDETMGLMDAALDMPATSTPAPSAPPPVPVTAAPAAKSLEQIRAEKAAYLARLEAEEKEAEDAARRAVAAKAAPPPPTPEQKPPTLLPVNCISQGPNGALILKGVAAARYCHAASIKNNDGLVQTTAAHLQLYGCAIGPVEEAQVLPSDAPKSDPAKAADPVPPETLATLSPEVQEAVTEAQAPVTEQTAAPESAPKKRGRPPKNGPAQAATAPGTGVIITAQSAELEVYCDCLPPEPVENLDPWVSKLMREMAESAGLLDIRLAPDGHGLSFGKWKAALEAKAAASPPPNGSYFLVVRGDDARAAVARGLASVGRIIRGCLA